MAYELLSNALRNPKGLFDLQKDRSNFSMDSYYPVISGCLNKNEIEEAIQQTLNNFYEDGLGIKCVREEPWITVAETNEFVIALVIGNKKDLAKKILLESTLISDKNNIKTVTIKSSIVVPKSGWIKIKNKFNKIPANATNKLTPELSILAKNNTKIILLNSDGCIKTGNPIGSKSYHLLTPNIGAVKSKPSNTEIERANKGFIKL